MKKKEVIEVIKKMPDSISVDDVIEELYFKQKVDKRLAELDKGRSIPQEEAKKRMKKWLRS